MATGMSAAVDDSASTMETCFVKAPPSIQRTYSFAMVAANADGTTRSTGNVKNYWAGDTVIDDKTEVPVIHATSEEYIDSDIEWWDDRAWVHFCEVVMPLDGDYYYRIEQRNAGYQDVQYDDSYYVVHFDTTQEYVLPDYTHYASDGTVISTSPSAIEFYNYAKDIYHYHLNVWEDGRLRADVTLSDEEYYAYIEENGLEVAPEQGESVSMSGQSGSSLYAPVFVSVSQNENLGTFDVELLLDDQDMVPIRIEDGKRYFAVRIYIDSTVASEFLMYEGEVVVKTIAYASSVGANLGVRAYGFYDTSDMRFYPQKLSFVPLAYVLFVNSCENVVINDCVIEGDSNCILVANSTLSLTDCELYLRNGYNSFITETNSTVNETNVTKKIRLG